jgi:hypothetical protein|nr:MAG TPA: BRO family protein [Caudoviricetes sp.]
MDKVSVFESSDFGELRIIVDPKGDVWFVASDVAKSLGYVNAKDAIKRHVDDDDSIILQVSNNQWGVNQSLLKTRYIDNIRIIKDQYSERNVWHMHMITKQDIQAAASYIFRSSFVSENQARKVTIRAGNKATKNLVKTFRGKLFKKAFGRARRGKDISSFERQEKESGFNFLYNLNNSRMRSGHIIIDGIGLFKQIIYEVQH